MQLSWDLARFCLRWFCELVALVDFDTVDAVVLVVSSEKAGLVSLVAMIAHRPVARVIDQATRVLVEEEEEFRCRWRMRKILDLRQ